MLTLIDAWSSKSLTESYKPFNTNELQIGQIDLKEFGGYFGGNIDTQDTFDTVFKKVSKIFAGKKNVEIIRENTHEAVHKINSDSKFDLIYIDACHQYEFVLRDLLLYSRYLDQNSLIILNDYVRNDESDKQNIGVQVATKEFLNRNEGKNLEIICVCKTDVVIGYINSKINKIIRNLISLSDYDSIELPSQLATHANLNGGNLSFCGR